MPDAADTRRPLQVQDERREQVRGAPHVREQPLKDLEQHGARVARTAREVASASDIVLASLPSNEASEEVALGADGVLTGASDGDIYVELSTISPHVVRRISREAAEIGVEVLDAPVSGGMAQRREGSSR